MFVRRDDDEDEEADDDERWMRQRRLSSSETKKGRREGRPKHGLHRARASHCNCMHSTFEKFTAVLQSDSRRRKYLTLNLCSTLPTIFHLEAFFHSTTVSKILIPTHDLSTKFLLLAVPSSIFTLSSCVCLFSNFSKAF